MNGPTKSVISILNNLIETCKDGQEGFKTCAEDIKNPELKALFTKHAHECAEAAGELQAEVIALGGTPEDSTSLSGDLHRRWVDVKSIFTGKDEEAVLNEAERGEDVALAAYKDALAQPLPAHVHSIIERQQQGVQRNHDEIKALR
ncbi:aldehyde dehydrogenase, partial [Pseudomonas putida]